VRRAAGVLPDRPDFVEGVDTPEDALSAKQRLFNSPIGHAPQGL